MNYEKFILTLKGIALSLASGCITKLFGLKTKPMDGRPIYWIEKNKLLDGKPISIFLPSKCLIIHPKSLVIHRFLQIKSLFLHLKSLIFHLSAWFSIQKA
jgi:hypothetical protein